MIFVVSSRERAFPVYLAFLSYYDVIPVLQESLCYKGMRDEDSIEMMNLVLETEVVDLTTAAGIANEQMTKICNDIVKGKLQFASYMEKQTQKINANIEKLRRITYNQSAVMP